MAHNHNAKVLKITLYMAVLLLIVEFVIGWIANSLALMTDAAHVFADIGSVALSLFAFHLSARPKNSKMSYGYLRAEILAALANALILCFLSGFIILEAIERISNPPPVKGPLIIVVGLVAIVVNIINIKILHPSQKENLNIRGTYLHILSDLLGSISVVIAGTILWLTSWSIVDPIVSIVFSLLILFQTWRLIKETVTILMECSPKDVNPEQIKNDLLEIPKVVSIHDLHIWSLTNQHSALSVHLLVENGARTGDVLVAADKLLREKHKIPHSTIQVEDPSLFDTKTCCNLGDKLGY